MKGGDIPAVLSAGMPNILGEIGNTAKHGFTRPEAIQSGALFAKTQMTYDIGEYINSKAYTIGLDASKSNSVYGNADTVQPPAIMLLPQIKY